LSLTHRLVALMDCETGYSKVAWASRINFTNISEHARLEIPMDLRDQRAFSPPRPASGRADCNPSLTGLLL